MSHSGVVTIRCRCPHAMYLLLICPYLPVSLARMLAIVCTWLAWWQIDYGDGWRRLHLSVEVTHGDDDDRDGGIPAYVYAQ